MQSRNWGAGKDANGGHAHGLSIGDFVMWNVFVGVGGEGEVTRDQFIETFGEAPEDMFGEDWENILEEFDSQAAHEMFGVGMMGL